MEILTGENWRGHHRGKVIERILGSWIHFVSYSLQVNLLEATSTEQLFCQEIMMPRHLLVQPCLSSSLPNLIIMNIRVEEKWQNRVLDFYHDEEHVCKLFDHHHWKCLSMCIFQLEFSASMNKTQWCVLEVEHSFQLFKS